MVSRELDKECVIVFDEAHNIDNVCIEVRFNLHLFCSVLAIKPGMEYLSWVLPADHDDNLIALPEVLHRWEACLS